MAKSLKSTSGSHSFALASKVKDYFQLIKFTLSFTVVFSTVVSYLLAPNASFDLLSILILFVAGMLITGSANAFNQAKEKDTDALMKRTASRPVAAGRMSVADASTFAVATGILGITLMWTYFNFLSAMIGLVSLILYAFIYTPLKKVNSIAVLVGAIPGALPCLIGWVAATGVISPFDTIPGTTVLNMGGWVLFSIQFIWQFPHFWAIAWISHKDYTTAGFKLLPSKSGPTKFTAAQSIVYSMLMIPIGLLPWYFHISGIISLWILLFCNLWMVYTSVMLFVKMNARAARMVMFSSYFYLMIVFLSLLFDKIR